ncbi:MAG: diguanylate cyclase [Rhodospirillales bacterium]|nr:diguanylate cyclase [Rhodospirillales bacterium]
MTYKLNSCCEDLLQKVEHFICICEDGIIVWINKKGLRLLRAPNPDSVLATPIANFVSDDFVELFADGLNLIGEESEGVPLNILTTSADLIDVNFHVSNLPSRDGHEYHMVECQDISDLIRASQATRGREQRINAILKAVDQAVITIDEFGVIKSVNDVAVKIFGHEKPDLLGSNISMLMPEPHRSSHDEYLVRYQSTGHTRVVDQTNELEGLRADGTVFPIEITVTEVRENNGRRAYVGSVRDITTQKAQEERIRFLALNDSLTGLPNRASFNDKINEAVSRARRTGNGVALMFIDLDKFKPVNDALGHEAGDEVLKTVARRLQEIIRSTDTAARLGGDEFVLILENIKNKETAAKVAKTLLEKIPLPITINDTTCSVGVSIGISHFPTDAELIPDLLNAADKAMYKVKEAGRNNFAFC